jgi:hypothetical protein
MTIDASRRTGTDPLAGLRGRFPGWEAWRGVSGLFYARRLRTSPPVIVRAATPGDLATKITEQERERGKR